jgi:hypothetical protein
LNVILAGILHDYLKIFLSKIQEIPDRFSGQIDIGMVQIQKSG